MQRYPIAYLRRSTADASDPGDVSREAQEQAVRALAVRDGHNGNLVTFTDWSRSASEGKTAARTQYAAMLARIEAGEVSHVYAYALDRLNRSLVMSARFARACEDNDVRIVTTREGEVRQDSPSEWLRWTILATFGEYELRTIQSRAAGALAVRRGRGDHIGRVGYGYGLARDASGAIVAVPDPDRPLEPIIAAVREAGSILGGAKLLQARGIPAPDGGTVWGSTTLRRIIERAAPSLIPTAGPTGRRQPSRSSVLAQLLVCHCDHVLTPEPSRAAYRCTRGNRIGREAHGTMWVSEAAILPWVKAEAARFDPHREGVVTTLGDRDDERRVAIIEQRRKLALGFARGALDDATYEVEDAALVAELAAIDARGALVDIPPGIRWTAEGDLPPHGPQSINTILRTYWDAVQLGPDLRPVRAKWRLPAEWLA